MSTDTITLTRQGERWFAIDEETGLTARGGTRQQALDSLDEAVEGDASHDDEVAIVKTHDVLHGQPRIDGTRIGVFTIGESVRRGGQSVDDLSDGYPDLTVNQIEAALAYYDSHPDEMATLRDETDQIIHQLQKHGRVP